jgi:hypothetical protein
MTIKSNRRAATPETRNIGMKGEPSRQKNKTRAYLLFKTEHLCLGGMILWPVALLSGVQTLTGFLSCSIDGIPLF